MHARLPAAAIAAVFLFAAPGAVWAQHGGHSSGGRTHGHASRPQSSANSHASHFHAPLYYLLRLQQDQRSGLYLGYPAGYPYYDFNSGGYLDPYSFYLPSPTFLYGSPVPTTSTQTGSSTTQTPSSAGLQRVAPASIGEVRLRINPGRATVLMDGVDVGTADDYSGPAKLALVGGLHHFELRAPGYQTLAFDVDVRPGRVIPYQAVLRPEP
jgi:PEGA domain